MVQFRPEPPLSLGTYSRNALQPKTCCAARQRSLSVDFRRTCFPCLLGNRAWLPLSTDQHHSRNRQRLGPIRIGILGPSDFWVWIRVNDLPLEFRKVRKKTFPSCVMSGRRNNRDVESTKRINIISHRLGQHRRKDRLRGALGTGYSSGRGQPKVTQRSAAGEP